MPRRVVIQRNQMRWLMRSVFVRVSPVFSSSAECWALGMLASGNTCVYKFHIKRHSFGRSKGSNPGSKFIFICCYFTHVSGADEHNTVLHPSNSSPKKPLVDPNRYYYYFFLLWNTKMLEFKAALFRTTQPVKTPHKKPIRLLHSKST